MTTNEGISSEATAYIWGKYFLVSYVNPRPALKAVSHAYQFAKSNSKVVVKEWTEQKLGGQWIEGSIMYDSKVVSTLAGYLMIDPVS
jgi:hypothetical protein